jgi:Sporulation and spore germination
MRWRRPLVATAVAVVVSACTIGGSEDVEEVDPDLLSGLNEPSDSTAPTTTPESTTPASTEPQPPGSGDGASTTSTAASTTTVVTAEIAAYFIAGSQLIETKVEVESDDGLAERLRALEAGPSEADVAQGARTALPPGLIEGLRIDGDAVTVDLNGEQFALVDPDDHRLMIGQIVMTVTEQPNGIAELDFTLDGEPLPVYRRDNTQTSPGETVTADDYEVLVTADRTAVATTEASDSTESSVSLTDGP